MTSTPKDATKAEINRCPKCGSSDITLDESKGKLKCSSCRGVFEAEAINATGGVEDLAGNTVGAGASNIIPSDDIIATLRCPSCGSEVVVNTSENLSIKCHWCRHILTIKNKIPNGAIPDFVLPFKIEKRVALDKIRAFIKEECDSSVEISCTSELVEGVYFPYMVVDVKGRMEFAGVSEKTISSHGGVFDIEAYNVLREFDILVDDLIVESSTKRLNQDLAANSNNIINAILPFDVENAVSWDANYLRGYTSEKRDVNIGDLKEVVATQVGDIARVEAKKTMSVYDRGTHWQREHLGIKGAKWKAAYLPVWLFSYKRADGRLFYVAMNGRTGEISGYLPKNAKKKSENKALLAVVSIVVLLACFNVVTFVFWVITLIALIRYLTSSGSNDDAVTAVNSRHKHEAETKAKVENLVRKDEFRQRRSGVSQREIPGRNDIRTIGSLSTGRAQMSYAEMQRLNNGRNYTKTNTNTIEKAKSALITADIVLSMIAMIVGGVSDIDYSSSYSSGSESSYSSSYDSDSSSWGWSSYDSDSSWSSSDYSYDYGSGFDYSYDYDW